MKQDISFLNHVFISGETVEFEEDSYDPKGGVIRFWFKNHETGETNAWHIWENQLGPLQEWASFFEPLTGGE